MAFFETVCCTPRKNKKHQLQMFEGANYVHR